MAKYDYKKLAKKKKFTEKELNALKNHMNKLDYSQAGELNNLVADKYGTKLDKTQVAKGKKYLYNLGFTSKGVARKNNPYGYREEYIVKNLKTIELLQFHDAGNRNFSFYVPYYEAIGKDGTSMEYFVSGGKINIWG
jgi:ribosomal protein L32E